MKQIISRRCAAAGLTLARVGLRRDGEAGGTGAGKASHDVVARMRAGRLERTLIFI